MNWGNSLLVELIDTSPIEEWFAGVLYHIGAFVWGIFYIIWMWLAKLVNIIEKIFKNLAGIGESSSDMVSTIIESEAIRDIFQNLVALSMALIVFFTIIKIIQDHYKDTKSGGNPYQTVLRTFKGLLMFFFVTTAVSVGLYASGVMFRALDAATGSESSSVSGQIFKAMAAEANRKRIGPAQSGLTKAEKNKYYSRLTNTADNSNGRYFITVVSGDTSLSSQALKEAYYKAFPALQYGVVNEDGSVTPVVRWLGTQARSLDIQDVDELIDRMKGNLADDNGFSDDYSSGSFGYSNDFLTGLSINIQPSISLTWSPLDIQTFSYRLYEYGTPEPDEINTSFFGNGITVKHGFRKFKFFSTGDKVQKDMSEAAKVLGFTFNAGIGFQDKGVTSYYDLNTYNIEKFVPILQSVLGNIGYTGALEWLLQNIPAFYGAYYFGKAFEINWISMLGNAIRIVIECLADEPFTVKDEEGNVICTPISFNPASFNTGVWSTVNLGSPNLDVSIEQYRVDHNFTELWSSIKDSLKDVVNQFDGDVQSRYEQMSEEAASAINSVSSLMQKQADMLAYKGYVDTYNSEALENLTNLGNCLQLYDNVKAMDEDQRNSYFNRDDVNYKGTFASLKSDIRSTWCNLVKNYNEKIKGKLPTSYYADPRVSYSIYKPIIEFAISDYQASSGDFASDDGNGVPADSAIDAIKKAMVNDQGTGKVSVNMLIDDVTDSSVYRMVDWGVYGPAYGGTISVSELKNYADIYASKDYINGLTADAKNKKVFNNESVNDLRFGSIAANTTGTWNDLGGIRYFIGLGSNKNDFKSHSVANGVRATLKENGYWALDGIHVDNDQWNVMYVGKRIEGVFPNNLVSDQNLAYNGTNSMRTSSAKINASRTEYAESELHKSLTAKADKDLLNDFKNNIITFRKLDTAAGSQQQDADKAVLKDWMQTAFIPGVHPGVSHKEIDLTDEGNDAAYIDDLMAAGSDSTRRYLMLTKECETDFSNTNNWGEYIGRVSWDEYKTVKALYELDEIHYVMGFIGIITAVGVYMNFTFGLIQRAINMSVLYIMSPITIAFYPFDDGQRFKSSFVTPFYKEAISAYAVIVSLNLFFVLMNPLTRAAEQAVGGGVSGYFIGWLALVAFVSMLPKIRDSICSILGAGSMSSQSLTDTFKNAGKSIGTALGDLGTGLKLGASAHQLHQNRKMRKRARNEKLAETLQAKVDKGEDTWVDRMRLRRLNKGAGITARDQKMQERIDAALKSGNVTGLTASEKKRYDKQQKIAKKMADKKNMKIADVVDTDEFKNKAKKNYTIIEKGFGLGVDGVNKLKAAPAALGSLMKNTGEKFGKSKIMNNSFMNAGKGLLGGVADLAKNSLAGEWVEEHYGAFGDKLEGKSALSQTLRMFNKYKKVEDQNKFFKRLEKEELTKREVQGKVIEPINKAVEGQKTKDSLVAELTKQEVALETVNNSGLDVSDKVFKMMKAEEMRTIRAKNKDMNDDEIEAAAEENVKQKLIKNKYGDAASKNKSIYLAAQKDYWMNNHGYSEQDAEKEALKNYDDIIAYKHGVNLEDRIHDLGFKTCDDLVNEEIQNFDLQNFSQNNADFINAQYIRMGGDAKLSEGIAKSWKEYADVGLKVDFDDDNIKEHMADIESKIRNDMAGGAGKIKLSLDTEIKSRDEALDTVSKTLSSELALKDKSKEASVVKEVLKNANHETSFDDLVEQIASKAHLDHTLVREKLGIVYPDFAQNVQFNQELEIKNKMYDAAAAFEKGIKDCMNKLGDNVPAAAREAIVKAFINLYDGNFNSTNPESLGYQQNLIKQKYSGDINDKECREEMDEIAKRMNSAATLLFQEFTQKYGHAIREHDFQQKMGQDLRAVASMSILPELQKQIELNASINLNPESINLLNKDKMLQEIKEQGDYALAGQTVQLAVDAVLKHDYDALEKLKLDETTKEKLKRWEQEGGESLKTLLGMAKYEEFITTKFGTMSADMGGESFQGIGAALRNLITLGEQKVWLSDIEGTIKNWSDEEGHNRAVVNAMINKIDTMFAGDVWNDLHKQFKDMNGKIVQNTEEFTAAMRETLDACNNDVNNEYIEHNLKVLQAYRDDNVDKQTIYNTLSEYLDSISRGRTGNWLSDQIQGGRATASDIKAKMADTITKLKPLLSEGK